MFSEGPVTVVGFFSATTGLGQGARLIYSGLKDIGIDVRAIDLSSQIIPHLVRTNFNSDVDPLCGTIIFHINPPEVLDALAWFQPETLLNRRRIGFWLWELETAPQSWQQYLKYFDEIWSPSLFSANAISQLGAKVKHTGYPFQYGKPDPKLSPVSRNREIFTALVIADTQSSIARKNPLASLLAFQSAFPNTKNVRLIVKLSNAGKGKDDYQTLKSLIGADSRLILIEETLNSQAMQGLIVSADVLLNLHRAEGYGLPIVEALQSGVPAIYTNWSSPQEFNHLLGSYPVEYTLTKINDKQNIYKEGLWAEPDSRSAQKALEKVYENWFSKNLSEHKSDINQQIMENALDYFSVASFLRKNKTHFEKLKLF